MEFYPCYNMKTKKWCIKRHVPQKHGDTDKTVFPHQQFASSHEARVFLWEQGLLPLQRRGEQIPKPRATRERLDH